MPDSSIDQSHIRLRGVSVHNLQSIDLDLPHHRLIAICGVSGSGKTSLALDTLYAEGQRRYIESFSAYTRQFLQQLQKPEAQLIEGIPAAIAVTHKNPSRSNRATVGTETEVNDYLGLLFAHTGTVICHGCEQEICQDSPEAVAAALSKLPDGSRWMLGFETVVPEMKEIEHWLADLVEQGYVRAVVNDEVVNLNPALASQLTPDASVPVASVTVVLDRLVAGKVAEERLCESVESAMAAGEGSCVALVSDESKKWQRQKFSSSLRCESCDIEYPELQPQLFNFNRSLGACHECEGFGNVVLTDDDKVVPDRQKTLREGAIAPWNSPAYKHELEELLELAADYNLPVDVPYGQLTDDHLQLIQQGVPDRDFGGLDGFFKWLERRKYKMYLRVFLSRWKRHEPCPECHGARLKREVLAIRVGGKNFAEVLEMPINRAIDFFTTLSEPQALASGELAKDVASTSPEASACGSHHPIAARLLADVLSRLRYLQDVGVNYLTLDRPLRTLSAGEAQRVALTATLGSNLVDMLYVLDEPSIGLHPANVESLATSIIRLRDRGNSVVVVEHEELLLGRADHLVEVGPGAGQGGGKIVFQGTPAQALADEACVTGQWMAGQRGLGLAGKRRPHLHGKIQLQGARGRNLKNISVDFPLGVLCLVTGVSGAGKSTLVDETLYPALMRIERLNDGAPTGSSAGSSETAPLEFDNLLGTGQIEEVVRINDAPIGRSPRSNPITFIKAFDPIRKLFSEQAEAKAKGFGAGHFSFNVAGGRCDTCNGDGSLQVDMQFMADVFMPCQDCHGSRYRHDVLEVKYRGRDIAEVLNMTAREAFSFFRGQKKILTKLKCLLDVGLDYLRLGQSATTLSTGEAQRLKLAVYVGGKRRGRALFLLDEPTTGLHFSDILKLLDCFDALLDVGHSLILVEHNLQLMKAADWLIDLGPGAADQGGQVVAVGTPEKVAATPDSLTGRFLAQALANQSEA